MEKSLLRKLPSIDSLLQAQEVKSLIKQYSRDMVVGAARTVLQELRSHILSGISDKEKAKALTHKKIVSRVEKTLQHKFSPSLKPAINATGVILHTGLGRAVLSESARSAINSVMEGYSTLAIEMSTGRRGHRDIHLNAILCELTGAEASVVVNNNAAATMLILNTLAQGKEVIVSRGQLVEIGGSFRMPDVMRTSGAVLKEVGTTNKTHLRDYAEAITEETGAIMRVHHSNYRILGFSSEPSIEEMVELARKHNLPLIDDLGSGALVDLQEFGLETEPLVQHSIKAGVDVACFSGDKLIGGPQAGVIVGKSEAVKKIGKNPLMRAFRVGKMTIAGMEATLRLFYTPEKLPATHPVYRMFAASQEQLRQRAEDVYSGVKSEITTGVEFSLVEGESQVGSGSAPIETIPTVLLQVKPINGSADKLARSLRHSNPPIFCRVQKEAVLFDFRTIQPGEGPLIADFLIEYFKSGVE